MADEQDLEVVRPSRAMSLPTVTTKAASLDWTRPTKDNINDEGESILDVLPSEDKCSEDVDWEMIADYLSRCQSLDSAPSSEDIKSVAPPPALRYQRPSPRLQNTNPYLPNRTLLSRRNAANSPPSISKDLSSTQTTASPTVSPTSNPQPGLSTGAKAGIASVTAIGIIVILASLVAFHNRRNKKKYGYTRTKSRDGAAELDGHHFTVTTWPEPRESSPMIFDGRRRSDSAGVGLGIERPGGWISPGLSTGNSTTVMDHSDYNISRSSQSLYEATPNISYASNTPLINQTQSYTPPAQTYISTTLPSQTRSSPERQVESSQQSNQRARASHPLSLLSEAMPPPPIQARKRNSMADYQNAVPLGFANGFVQVDRTSEVDGFDARLAEPSWEEGDDLMVQPVRVVAAVNTGRNVDAHDGPDGDPALPSYAEAEMEGLNRGAAAEEVKTRHREVVRYDNSTGHYHIDSETESEDERQDRNVNKRGRRKSLTKEELG